MDGLDPARISMLTAGSALVVGSVSTDGIPLATRAWSADLVGGGRLRVAVAAGDPIAHDDEPGRRVAITAADVPTLDSVQVKGRVVGVDAPGDHDREVVHRQSESFFAAVHEVDGHPVELLRRLRPPDLLMLEIEIDEVFDQSPGPRAGTPIEAEA